VSEPRLHSASETDPEALHAFLERFFGSDKAAFLSRHGDWWHRGSTNRMAITLDGEIAAYCGVIPASCIVAGNQRQGLWWMDLVVAPEFRGLGLQSRFDHEVRSRSSLLLGFPNALAARIHRKHGWGVREDLESLALPLRPSRMPRFRRASGASGALLRLAAAAAEPFFAVLRHRWRRPPDLPIHELTLPSARELAALAKNDIGQGWITTARDADHFRWRYLDAPYRHELRFLVAGEPPRVGVILRLAGLAASRVARCLDLFGDLEDHELVVATIRGAVGMAVAAGASQITALAGNARLAAAFRAAASFQRRSGRFCWSTSDPGLSAAFATGDLHWTLGDSDNDEPLPSG